MIRSARFAMLMLAVLWTAPTWAQSISRERNPTLKMPRELISGFQYQLTECFPELTFEKPVAVTSPTGDTSRLFVVERVGRIIVITNWANPTRHVFLDVSSGVYSDWDTGKVEGLSSLAFHPNYLNSRFPLFYVTYTLQFDGPDGWGNYNRLARFQSSRAFPNEASARSESPLITQRDHGEGHNFNDVAFGPDGYLYVAVGDEGDGGKGDDFNNAQQIDKNFFAGILRIDVDQRLGSLPPNSHPGCTSAYSVPPDNPWVGATNFCGKPVDPGKVRTEFYAVGLRNPWRMSFDTATGVLYAGDVGQHGREEINLIVRGGNYGWSLKEGTLPGPKGPPPAGLTLLDPIHEYSPGYGSDGGFAITGGRVYRGQKLSELAGAYIFADYVTGNIWALHHDGTKAMSVQRLAGRTGIAGFGINPRDGEILLVDHDRGKLLTLERAVPPVTNDLPATLAETGAFVDLTTLTPSAGIEPYEINLPFWSDGAAKKRWFAMPNTNATIGFSRDGNWQFPTGTVWIKHFELTNAVSNVVHRLETRLLVKTESGVYGVTYRWGDSLTNAVIVPEEGMDETILVQDQDGVRSQTWHYPSRSECLACHTPAAGYALGFNTAQLNLNRTFGGIVTNQLRALSAAGCFQTTVSNIHTLLALASLSDETVSRESRVRSYLSVECASCHYPGNSARAGWDARFSSPLRDAGIVNGAVQGTRSDPSCRIVKPGSLERSVLFWRISELGKDHMPPIGSSVLNQEAIKLVRDWILLDLPRQQPYPDWQQEFFGSTNSYEALVEADPDEDGAVNYLEYLTGRHPLQSTDVWRVGIQRNGDLIEIFFPQKANRIFEVQWSDNLLLPKPWQPLDVFENRPIALALDQIGVVPDHRTNGSPRFYRVTVREP